VKLSKRYGVDVMISDGNLLLSGAGRAFNYRGPINDPPSAEDIDHAFSIFSTGRDWGLRHASACRISTRPMCSRSWRG